MILPILISVSVAPVSYSFCANAPLPVVPNSTIAAKMPLRRTELTLACHSSSLILALRTSSKWVSLAVIEHKKQTRFFQDFGIEKLSYRKSTYSNEPQERGLRLLGFCTRAGTHAATNASSAPAGISLYAICETVLGRQKRKKTPASPKGGRSDDAETPM